MASDDIQPNAKPSLNLPESNSTVEVSIINTTTDIVVPAWAFVQPVLKGHETMNMPTFAFLVKNKKLGKNIMFDLGCRKDWWNFAPMAYKSIATGIPALSVAKNINEILEEGDPSLFPKSAELIVGPGFSEAFLPGYPTKQDSPMLEGDFKGRKVREITFDKNNRIGQYPSYDLFGDGSFYILDVPGHAIGHISGLARTTPDTFVFMGGDVCHFGGSYRPTRYAPLPATLPPEIGLDKRFNSPCPCSVFTACHRDQDNARTSPFYQVTQQPGG
ncbi:MAG: hypothetical protein Q9169_007090, partial [Polycauliona sp. 2 TL-2023]